MVNILFLFLFLCFSCNPIRCRIWLHLGAHSSKFRFRQDLTTQSKPLIPDKRRGKKRISREDAKQREWVTLISVALLG
ncbi:hypothetical protein BDV24DRAFT_135167 [Aspergillus arachidicola]|uniref:Secreted protein n=1 Tax=Aspergillus arachidicola TaxID=656916 RepID=A0A5N6Y363_9EURO|nr:hypothetical protein BDV24DRAFT_135167 [Aspergillus arachidicola]